MEVMPLQGQVPKRGDASPCLACAEPGEGAEVEWLLPAPLNEWESIPLGY